TQGGARDSEFDRLASEGERDGIVQAATVGLGFLRGAGPQGEVRLRRIRSASLLRDGACVDRRRAVRRARAPWPFVQGAQGPAHLSPGRTRVRSIQSGRFAARLVP